tara:strand:+ start:333 stop:494 length:162 start_codon:yes stop_codon:yes gene_type:complete
MKSPKKYSINQRLTRIEKAVGELYVMMHHIANRIEPTENQSENDVSDPDGSQK